MKIQVRHFSRKAFSNCPPRRKGTFKLYENPCEGEKCRTDTVYWFISDSPDEGAVPSKFEKPIRASIHGFHETQLTVGRISVKRDYVHRDMSPETRKNTCRTGLTS